AQVGDVVKADAEFHVDGIEITEVFAPKKKKERTDLLELKSRPLRDDELVTTQRSGRGGRRGGGRREGGNRGGRRGERGGRHEPPPEVPQRPKPKRLRPKRVHREALLAEVGDEYRPIIEQVMAEGMPGVRAAIDKQNAEATEAGKPPIDAAPILAIAEKNLQKARLAEWLDRAEAALADADELDLRDLRSVVVTGNDVARDQQSRELSDQLRERLDQRVETDHNQWLEDLEAAVASGRVVRALRLSSRPVKAGAPLPAELASTLAGQASEALSTEVGQDRWATVLDALAFSPVRGAVTPVGVPADPRPELIDAVKRLSDRVPAIAALFGIDPATVPRSARRRRPRDRRGGGGDRGRGQDGNRGGGKGRADARSGQNTPNGRVPSGGAPTQPEAADATLADASAPAEAPGGAETTDTDAATPAETTDTDAATPAEPTDTDGSTPAETTDSAAPAEPTDTDGSTPAADATETATVEAD
ncbi:MAG: hypothetical protein ACK5PP_00580, partial [Acidimicrobiales bacterium]